MKKKLSKFSFWRRNKNYISKPTVQHVLGMKKAGAAIMGSTGCHRGGEECGPCR